MILDVVHHFLPKTNTVRAAQVMDHFGIDFEQGEHVVARDCELPVEGRQVVLFTGESGSGKSSLMGRVAAELRDGGARVVNLDELTWEDRVLVDLLPLPLEESLQLLAACGLGEAQLMLRTPSELSDGQRYRFRLALALAQSPDWIMADEFTATLDRRLACMIAGNLHKLAVRRGTGCLLATTHDDVAADLCPDVHVRCRLDGEIVTTCGSDLESCIKKKPREETGCGSPPRPNPTGRISHGGITAATTWASSG